MPDPKQQAATQLANITEATGHTLDDFTDLVAAAGLNKHGQIIKFLKTEHGLTHGNANLIAALVREAMAGGPPEASTLLDAQYEGPKAALRPLYEELAAIASSFGDDIEVVVQKTGVSFRRAKQFALIQCPSRKRIQLGLNLTETPEDERVREAGGMCSHRVDLADPDEVDDNVARWLHAAYEAAA